MSSDARKRLTAAFFVVAATVIFAVNAMIIVTSLGVFAGVVMANMSMGSHRASEAVLKQNLVAMRKAIDDFYADNRRYPVSLEELVERRYLRSIPRDPITESSETWQTILEEMQYRGSAPAIIDVKSGADGKTHDEASVSYHEL